MSHFAVIVIGDDVEGQLAPYDENLEVEPYPQECYCVELTGPSEYKDSEGKPQRIEWGAKGAPRAGCDECDGTGKHMSTYSPRAKWDWWSIGGRWSPYFKVMENSGILGTDGAFGRSPEAEARAQSGLWADQVVKRFIDWEGMVGDERTRAEKHYDSVVSFLGTLPSWTPWEDVLRQHGLDVQSRMADEGLTPKLDAARAAYGSQPQIKQLREDPEHRFSFDADPYLLGRSGYAKRWVNLTVMSFAVVKEGEWHERGRMGWWAVVSDEKAESEWIAEWQRLVGSAGEDELFTAVDCHI